MFTDSDGRSFDRTAHFLWDRLLSGALEIDTVWRRDDRENLYELHEATAQKAGLPVFERLKAKHEQFLAEREKNGRHHFEVRLQQLNQIGLPEVRRFRQRQLELERATWQQEIKALHTVRPSLNPVILIRIESSR